MSKLQPSCELMLIESMVRFVGGNSMDKQRQGSNESSTLISLSNLERLCSPPFPILFYVRLLSSSLCRVQTKDGDCTCTEVPHRPHTPTKCFDESNNPCIPHSFLVMQCSLLLLMQQYDGFRPPNRWKRSSFSLGSVSLFCPLLHQPFVLTQVW